MISGIRFLRRDFTDMGLTDQNIKNTYLPGSLA